MARALDAPWRWLKREAKVALRTLGAAWLGLSAALLVWGLAQPPRPRGALDWVLTLLVGSLLCSAYTIWPASLIALARAVYRVLGAGAYVGASLVLLGVTTALYLARHLFGALSLEVFAAAGTAGPCGAHAGGAGAIFALVCLAAAVLSSPASCWALLKLILALAAALTVGALPGIVAWLWLLLRRARRWASGNAAR